MKIKDNPQDKDGSHVDPERVVAHMNLTLIEVAEPHLLDLVQGDRRCGPLVAERISPTLAVVAPAHTESLLSHLRRLDFLPRVVTPAKGRR